MGREAQKSTEGDVSRITGGETPGETEGGDRGEGRRESK